jgi:hypothetical protein
MHAVSPCIGFYVKRNKSNTSSRWCTAWPSFQLAAMSAGCLQCCMLMGLLLESSVEFCKAAFEKQPAQRHVFPRPTNSIAAGQQYRAVLIDLVVWCAADDAMKLMVKGAAQRTTGQTKLNAESSRSHCVFVMRVECRTTLTSGVAHVQYGNINLVDLAGSERIKLTGTEGVARVEAVPPWYRHLKRALSRLFCLLQDSLQALLPTCRHASLHVPSFP